MCWKFRMYILLLSPNQCKDDLPICFFWSGCEHEQRRLRCSPKLRHCHLCYSFLWLLDTLLSESGHNLALSGIQQARFVRSSRLSAWHRTDFAVLTFWVDQNNKHTNITSTTKTSTRPAAKIKRKCTEVLKKFCSQLPNIKSNSSGRN